MAVRSSCFTKSVEGIADACGEIQYQQLELEALSYSTRP